MASISAPLLMPGHPRMGGEHRVFLSASTCVRGSSPRGRGTRLLSEQAIHNLRVIPAWAGNTPCPGRSRPRRAGHPRVGGEHYKYPGIPSATGGSSPRGRGTPCTSTSGRRSTTGHPRVGGEHLRSLREVAGERGSSPRGRGTRGNQMTRSASDRVIPAWAGNTKLRVRGPVPSAGHPRVGGEHLRRKHQPNVRPGSSPRGRGTLYIWNGTHPRRGVIPAWAGNTQTTWR